MSRFFGAAGALGVALAVTGCGETTAAHSLAVTRGALAAAFSSVPQGYGSLSSSFVGVAANDASTNSFWLSGGRGASLDRSALMGGGLAASFAGGVGRGNGFGHEGPFGIGGLDCSGGTFSSTTGRVTCPAATLRNGLTVNNSVAYYTSAGAAQQAFDSLTTNTVNIQSAVAGTLTFSADSGRGDGHGRSCWGNGRGADGLLLGDTATIVSASTTVNGKSSETVSGLAAGSTQRVVNDASAGTEATTGTSSRGTFIANRVVGDTTTGLIVPISMTMPTYPAAGTVIRSMQATLTYGGQSPVMLSRREIVTYNGSATATVVITQNDTTRHCTKPLPNGPLSCS